MVLPKISIVTPSFNQAAFLEETIRSVLYQGYPDLEYIVMDGGSTDGSAESSEVRGSDRGLEERQGRGTVGCDSHWFREGDRRDLCWLNSDDTIAPGTLRRVGEFFAAHPDVELVYGELNLVDAEGKSLFTARPLLCWESLYTRIRLFLSRRCFGVVAFTNRSVGLDPSLRFAMDFDLVFRFLLEGARVRKLPRS